MSHTFFLELALPIPLREVFDYLPPEQWRGNRHTLSAGIRVQVPFGKRSLTGILLRTKTGSSLDKSRIKHACAILEQAPVLPPELLNLLLWAADYYQSPIGEVLQAALPTRLRQGDAAQWKPKVHLVWSLTKEGLGLPINALKNAPKQAKIIQALQQNACISRNDFIAQGYTPDTLNRLHAKGLIASAEKTLPPDQPTLEPPLTLNSEQQAALDAIKIDHFSVSLLDGTTGSGKTEIYLQVIANIILTNQNAQALVLVPEIGLTPQTLTRFIHRFGDCVAALHSGLNDKERLNTWLRASTGDARIIIGTRSAVFTPFKNLSIVIVDEEHDPSFKQQDGFRYSARDLAVVRANKLGIPLILGSATPSLESIKNTQDGRYQHLILKTRAGNAQLTPIDVVDTNQLSLLNGLAPRSLNAIETHLHNGNQVLIFLNRRGFAPTLKCFDCNWIAECPNCDARLTLHHTPKHLRCHHCDYQCHVLSRCKACHSHKLQPQGQGTERSEQTLLTHFPRTPVLRIDRDSTRTKDSLPKLLTQINTGQPCILIGTQMLAKGHHFPNVTLVVIIDADSGLFSTDFRGPERMGQLLTQVAGRAGRAEKKGQVLLQSDYSQHPLLQTLIQQGYTAFARLIAQERQITLMPPFAHMALLRADALDNLSANAFLREVKQCAMSDAATPIVEILGPLPSLMERRGNRFRAQLQFKSTSRNRLKKMISTLLPKLRTIKRSKQLRWSIDIDPQDMS